MEEKQKKKSRLQFRLNVLFLTVFILFSMLIIRLGVVQIVFGSSFQAEVHHSEDVLVSNPVPRGRMYDAKGRLLVDNDAVKAITYTKSQQTEQEEILMVAERLADMIEQDYSHIPIRDKKDFWIIKHPQQAADKLTKQEREELEDKEEYALLLDRITDAELNSFSNAELEVLAIKRKMDPGYAFSTQIIKNEGVTAKEFAVVSAHLEELPGVNTTTDWKRRYLFGETFQTILGSTNDGLPADQLDDYLSLGYSRDDRVGKTFLEYQYEDVLRGHKEKIQYVTDRAGNPLEKLVLSEGSRGMDLQLTIDMELQQQVDKIVEEELRLAKSKRGNELLDRAFAVMLDPNTGEILAMSGKQFLYKDGKPIINDYTFGVLSTQYEVGSAIKGATVLAGYDSGAITPGQRIYDEPLNFKATPTKKSYTNMGLINDLEALKRSSNVYMFKTVMALAGKTYRGKGSKLSIAEKYYHELRSYYAQFGLGVKTGIDLPNESAGLLGPIESNGGLFIDMAIGQYDTYTPMQLAQYVATIANGGKRLKPHLVQAIYEPGDDTVMSGKLYKSIQPEILNHLTMSQSQINRVKEGFRQVYQSSGGTAYHYFSPPQYRRFSAAGKTGTAEAPYYGPKRSAWGTQKENLTLVGYAPHDNPEVAFAVVVPWAESKGNPVNKNIGKRILDAYFTLQGK